MSGLTDLILSQPLLGSTIKTEGNDSDPFAILSIINLKQHRAHSAVLPLISYLLEQLPPHSDIKGLLTEMLASGSKTEIGLILSARVMNLPVQTMPPTYSMLLEEIKWAVDDDEQYRFSHYLLLSKVYTEVTSTLDQMNQQHVKRKKKSASKEPEIFYFHAEDEILAKYAIAKASFAFRNHPGSGASDSRRAFQEEGIDPQGFLLLFEADRFSTAIQALSSASDSSE